MSFKLKMRVKKWILTDSANTVNYNNRVVDEARPGALMRERTIEKNSTPV